MERMLDLSGGEAPEKWDQFGNPIKYRQVIVLKKRDDVGEKRLNSKAGNSKQTSAYDIGSLRLEHFHKVLHFIVANLKNSEPLFRQEKLGIEPIVYNLEQDPYG